MSWKSMHVIPANNNLTNHRLKPHRRPVDSIESKPGGGESVARPVLHSMNSGAWGGGGLSNFGLW
jgi:hypothetical protein